MSGAAQIFDEKIKHLQAENASLRVKLQKARGALFCFRSPEGAVGPPEEYRVNLNAAKDFAALYDLKTLLDETAPETAGEGGLVLLARVATLEAAMDVCAGRRELTAEERAAAFCPRCELAHVGACSP